MNAAADFVVTLKQTARAIERRRWVALCVASVAAIACAVGVVLVPNRYESKAQVYVDTQTALKPLMAGLTFQPDMETQVRMLARTLVSRPNVERLLRTPDLGFELSSEAERQKLVTRLMEQIKILPTGAGNLYEISYRGATADSAQHLVEAVVRMFVDASAGEKRRDAEDVGEFIAGQIQSYEAKLVEAEDRLKDFKIRNFGVTGVSNQDYYTRVSALTDTVTKLRMELGAAEQSRDAYRRELAAEDPQLPILEATPGITGAPVPEYETRLVAQQKQLDELLRRYTEQHPDVIHARRVLSQLEADAISRKEAEARALSKLDKPGKAATSPVYQKLRVSLAEAEAQVAALRSQLVMNQSQLEQIRASASQRPQVEAELAQLNRDYEIIRKNYDAMVSRRESAALGAKLDQSSRLAEFRLVEPPSVSRSAVFPNRLHLALISVVASLLAGIGAAVLLDKMRPAFDDVKSLSELSGRPVLGAVSILVTPQAARDKRMGLVRFGAAFGVLLMLQAVWVGWVAMNPQIL
jgi:polysaccharide chain length determinant protein (PEP-CTERM system associated)